MAAKAGSILRALGLEIREPVLVEVTEKLDVGTGICVALFFTGF